MSIIDTCVNFNFLLYTRKFSFIHILSLAFELSCHFILVHVIACFRTSKSNMNDITPEPRRIRSFFIKDILEHRNPPTAEQAESSTLSRFSSEQSVQSTPTSYTVQHILGTSSHEERPVDPCSTGMRYKLLYAGRYTILYYPALI